MAVTLKPDKLETVKAAASPEGIKAKRALYPELEARLAALVDVLAKLEGTHSAQVRQISQVLRNEEVSPVEYQLLPKTIAEVLGPYLKLHLGRFMDPRGVHVEQLVHHPGEKDPLA